MIDYFAQRLGVAPLPEEFRPVFESALAEYEAKGNFALEEAYLTALHGDCDAFPRTLKEVLSAAAELRKDPAAALYVLFLIRAQEQRDLFKSQIRTIVFPEEKYPMLPFLALVPYIKKTYDDLVRRGLPADVIAQTVNQYEDCLFVYEKRFDRLGLNMRYFSHLQEYVDCEILNVDRLRFGFASMKHPVYTLRHRQTGEYTVIVGAGEMTADGLVARTAPKGVPAAFTASFEETDDAYRGTPARENGTCSDRIATYYKKDYELVLKPGDLCLATHIHPYGALTREACMASYRRTLELVRKHYPELDFRAFSCHSWMMSPELAEVMKPGSKVLDFQSFYNRFPVPTRGEGVLNFVFYMKGYHDYTQLPEDTSLQRALKQRYLAGGRLNEYGGVMPFDRVEEA